MLRKRDVVYACVYMAVLLVPAEYRASHVIERLSVAGAEVENTAVLGVFHEPQIDFGAITHIHKVTLLLAIGIAVSAFEQTSYAIGEYLSVEVKRSGRHAAFVRFTRAIDIEVAQAHHLMTQAALQTSYVLVELKF